MEIYRSPYFVKSWKYIEAHEMIEKWKYIEVHELIETWSNKQIQLHRKKAQQEVH